MKTQTKVLALAVAASLMIAFSLWAQQSGASNDQQMQGMQGMQMQNRKGSQNQMMQSCHENMQSMMASKHSNHERHRGGKAIQRSGEDAGRT